MFVFPPVAARRIASQVKCREARQLDLTRARGSFCMTRCVTNKAIEKLPWRVYLVAPPKFETQSEGRIENNWTLLGFCAHIRSSLGLGLLQFAHRISENSRKSRLTARVFITGHRFRLITPRWQTLLPYIVTTLRAHRDRKTNPQQNEKARGEKQRGPGGKQ